jgi:hypothetical protein
VRAHESVAWAELLTIGIRIENQGLIDVPYWILRGRTSDCMYPNDAVGHEQTMSEFKTRLPGFDNAATYAAFVQGMSAQEGGVMVWQRPSNDAALTLRCTRPATAGFARFRRWVNSNYKGIWQANESLRAAQRLDSHPTHSFTVGANSRRRPW